MEEVVEKKREERYDETRRERWTSIWGRKGVVEKKTGEVRGEESEEGYGDKEV